MSELQDVIATSSIKAFNHGMRFERERIAQLIERLGFRWDGDKQTVLLDKREIVMLIESGAE